MSLPVTALALAPARGRLGRADWVAVGAVVRRAWCCSASGAGAPGEVRSTPRFVAALWVGVAALGRGLGSSAGAWPARGSSGLLAGLGYAGSAISVRGRRHCRVDGRWWSRGARRAGVRPAWRSGSTRSACTGRPCPSTTALADRRARRSCRPLVGVGLLGDGVREGWWPAVVARAGRWRRPAPCCSVGRPSEVRVAGEALNDGSRTTTPVRRTSSICFISSSSSRTPAALTFSVTCSGRLAPTIAEETLGFCSTHATASWARLTGRPRRRAAAAAAPARARRRASSGSIMSAPPLSSVAREPAGRLLARLVLAGQRALGDRRPDDLADARAPRRSGTTSASMTRHSMLYCGWLETSGMCSSRASAWPRADLLGPPLRDADVERLAGVHDVGERLHRLLQRRLVVVAVRLVEVDVVGAEPAQRAVDRLQDVLAGQAVVVVPAGPGRPVDLGEDLQPLAALALRAPCRARSRPWCRRRRRRCRRS